MMPLNSQMAAPCNGTQGETFCAWHQLLSLVGLYCYCCWWGR